MRRGWLAGVSALVLVGALGAQTAAVPGKSVWRPGPPVVRVRVLNFSSVKPVMGLPLRGSLPRAYCANDGTAFVRMQREDGGEGMRDLFSVTSDGGVRRLLRTVPKDLPKITEHDFFVGEQRLVTLLEAAKREDDGGRGRDAEYFLSLIDHDGDGGNVIDLALRFKPLKVAQYASGDLLMLGWDEGNQLPVMAMLKDDGTVRRFVELEVRRPGEKSVAQERVTAKDLQGAAFVPFGSEMLLTYPGTTKAIRALGLVGEGRMVPLRLPAGYVLKDVFAGDGRGPLVVRVVAVASEAKGKDAEVVRERMFEVNSYNGQMMRELMTEKPTIAEVACAPRGGVTAMFYDTVAGTQSSAEAGTQLVVGTAMR